MVEAEVRGKKVLSCWPRRCRKLRRSGATGSWKWRGNVFSPRTSRRWQPSRPRIASCPPAPLEKNLSVVFTHCLWKFVTAAFGNAHTHFPSPLFGSSNSQLTWDPTRPLHPLQHVFLLWKFLALPPGLTQDSVCLQPGHSRCPFARHVHT